MPPQSLPVDAKVARRKTAIVTFKDRVAHEIYLEDVEDFVRQNWDRIAKGEPIYRDDRS